MRPAVSSTDASAGFRAARNGMDLPASARDAYIFTYPLVMSYRTCTCRPSRATTASVWPSLSGSGHELFDNLVDGEARRLGARRELLEAF